MTNRIESLDWLRGLMALAIMFYHLTYWHYFPLDSSAFLGRLGVYGVSVFFVLSGLSMAIVYSKFIVDRKSIVAFYIRRIFRIWPLLWLCIALVIIPTIAKGGEVSLEKIFLNLTTLFGFVSPGSYINTGAWSIGNEMVYYAFTPIIIMTYEKSSIKGNVLLLISFAVTVVFSFFLLDSEIPLKEQWLTYINPFNNLFLYVAGIAIYYNSSVKKIKLSQVLFLFGIAIVIFMLYPVYGDKIAIVTGVNRLVFLFATILLVLSFYKFTRYDLIPKGVQYPLEQLGIATYEGC
ncbi:acyltransferase family protein [Candidatus Electrothrix sp.]|uniref:acyltransferase family protein n=1 Tax=Candidatus Electrothrix sp. TaxID=2170559 RepID=UPI00405776C2